jgi:hypothetical protein
MRAPASILRRRLGGAEGEARSALDVMSVKEELLRFKAMVEGSVGNGNEVPMKVRWWREDITIVEDWEDVDGMLTELHRLERQCAVLTGQRFEGVGDRIAGL